MSSRLKKVCRTSALPGAKRRTNASRPITRTVLVVDATKWTAEDDLALERVASSGLPAIAAVNKIDNLRYLIIETAFCNREKQLAVVSKHLCPSMLAEELSKLDNSHKDINSLFSRLSHELKARYSPEPIPIQPNRDAL